MENIHEQIVYMDPEQLIPYAKNPRKNKDAIPLVANSIKDFGFKSPIIVDDKLVVINGHTRLEAAKLLGLKEVPVIIARDLTPAQVRAFRLADNKVAEASEWDEDMLQDELDALGDIFNMEDYGFLDNADLEDEPDAEDDDYEPDIPAAPKSTYGDIYELGEHRLMCGDCTKPEDIEKLLAGNVMDLCVTDPPYNVNYGSIQEVSTVQAHNRTEIHKIENDSMSDDEFYTFLQKFYTNMLASLREGGAFYIFHADAKGLVFRRALDEAGGQIKQILIWVKNNFVLGRQDYQWKHEPILYGWKAGAAHYFTDERDHTTVIDDQINPEKMTKAELIDWVKKVLANAPESTIQRFDMTAVNDLHPTMKPVSMIGHLVKNSSRKGENVLDCFAGSGSTLIACEQLNRRCFSMELDPRYCDVIIDRWEKATGEKAVKVNE